MPHLLKISLTLIGCLLLYTKGFSQIYIQLPYDSSSQRIVYKDSIVFSDPVSAKRAFNQSTIEFKQKNTNCFTVREDSVLLIARNQELMSVGDYSPIQIIFTYQIRFRLQDNVLKYKLYDLAYSSERFMQSSTDPNLRSAEEEYEIYQKLKAKKRDLGIHDSYIRNTDYLCRLLLQNIKREATRF